MRSHERDHRAEMPERGLSATRVSYNLLFLSLEEEQSRAEQRDTLSARTDDAPSAVFRALTHVLDPIVEVPLRYNKKLHLQFVLELAKALHEVRTKQKQEKRQSPRYALVCFSVAGEAKQRAVTKAASARAATPPTIPRRS